MVEYDGGQNKLSKSTTDSNNRHYIFFVNFTVCLLAIVADTSFTVISHRLFPSLYIH